MYASSFFLKDYLRPPKFYRGTNQNYRLSLEKELAVL